MRWEDERYVKLYTRDTATWLSLSFDAQAVLMMLLRKADGAGLVDLGRMGIRAVALVLGHRDQCERVEAAVRELIAAEIVALDGPKLVVIHYIQAQEAQASPAARKRAQRERDRDQLFANGFKGSGQGVEIVAALDRKLSREVTPVVTHGHAESREVTSGHDPSQPSPAQLIEKLPRDAVAPVADEVPPLSLAADPEPEPKPNGVSTRRKALSDRLVAAFLRLRGVPYAFDGPKDARGLSRLMSFSADDGEIERRWVIALQALGYQRCDSLAQLAAKWNAQTGNGVLGPARDIRRGTVRAEDQAELYADARGGAF